MTFTRSRRILALSFLSLALYAAAGFSLSRLLPLISSSPPSRSSFYRALASAFTPTPFRPLPITPTPFQPLHPTATPAPLPTAAPLPDPWDFHGIDFSDQTEPITILIQPPSASGVANFSISFIPGQTCVFGDGRACVSAYTAGSGRVIFVTIHSGVGGQGQSFRHAVEGTGINQPAYSLAEIQSILDALTGAEVTLTQGGRSAGDLRLPAAARVPAAGIADYFAAPVPAALAVAAEDSPALEPFLSPDRPLLVIETCGWKHPAENWDPGITGSTGSVYLAVIQAP